MLVWRIYAKRRNRRGGKSYEFSKQRLRRYKRKLKDYRLNSEKKEIHFAQETVLDTNLNQEDEINQDEGMPPILMELSYQIEEMTTEEAIMKFDLENLNALMYRNVSHQGLNMLYKRDDGAIGWVDPRGHRVRNVSINEKKGET